VLRLDPLFPPCHGFTVKDTVDTCDSGVVNSKVKLVADVRALSQAPVVAFSGMLMLKLCGVPPGVRESGTTVGLIVGVTVVG
jgi:hypothetical protein